MLVVGRPEVSKRQFAEGQGSEKNYYAPLIPKDYVDAEFMHVGNGERTG
jgi:hypothetical protein